jgi:hypothetical protein
MPKMQLAATLSPAAQPALAANSFVAASEPADSALMTGTEEAARGLEDMLGDTAAINEASPKFNEASPGDPVSRSSSPVRARVPVLLGIIDGVTMAHVDDAYDPLPPSPEKKWKPTAEEMEAAAAKRVSVAREAASAAQSAQRNQRYVK